MKLPQTDYINRMYTKFFGFRRNPFKTNPDTAYFFPGQSHEEAIAHLRYAISQEEGFISITGEKGIGKTTLCNSLLESLDERHLVAFISNAEQSPKRLIKRINKELGFTARSDNMKDLTDALNEFLMQKIFKQTEYIHSMLDVDVRCLQSASGGFNVHSFSSSRTKTTLPKQRMYIWKT